MLTPFRTVRHLAGSIFVLLLAATTAPAQTTPPAWLSAQAVAANDDEDAAWKIATDAAGNRYEAGSFKGTLAVGPTTLTSRGNYDGYLAKYTPTGALLWVRQLGSAGYDDVSGVALDEAGAVYITGSFAGTIDVGNGLRLNENAPAGTGSGKAFFARYSPLGVPEWVGQSTPGASGSAFGSDIGVDALGHVYVTGLDFGPTLTIGSTTLTTLVAGPDGITAYLVRLDAATGAVQTLTLPFAFLPSGDATFSTDPQVAVGAAGPAYVLCEFENSIRLSDNSTLTSAGLTDIAIIRIGADGRPEWQRRYGTTADDGAERGAVDATGNLYLAGTTGGPIGEGSLTLPNAGIYDAFLLKFTGTGSLTWARSLGGPEIGGFNNLVLDAAGNPYVTGYFSRTISFGTRTLTSTGGVDALVAAYSAQGEPRWVQQGGGPGDDVGYHLGLDAAGNVHVSGIFDEAATFGPFTLATTAPGTPTTFVARLGNAVLSTAPARPLALGFFPNPATSQVQLRGVAAGSAVDVLDGLGRVVRTTRLPADATISVQGLTPGLYLLRTQDAQGRPYAGRLVVE